MARTYHPDKNKHTQQLFILVKDAYEMLSNPIERAKFQRTSGSGSGSGGNTNSGSKSTKRSHPATKMSAEEAFRRRRQHEASEMAAKKRRHMEMKRKKEAAAKRRREAKNAEARKHREALLQQQMQDQIKKRGSLYMHRRNKTKVCRFMATKAVRVATVNPLGQNWTV